MGIHACHQNSTRLHEDAVERGGRRPHVLFFNISVSLSIPAKAGIHYKDDMHYVYILASKRNGTLYIGVTTDLIKRTAQHKEKQIEGYTKKYNVDRLVYFETYDDYWDAANREKRMKKWNRDWKIELIEKDNPEWKDLYASLL